jgi:hypothetical protein
MKFFGILGREPSSNRRLNLIGIAVIFLTIAVAGLTIWDLRREAVNTYTQQINNLGVAFAEQTSRNLQAVDLVLDQANVASIPGRSAEEPAPGRCHNPRRRRRQTG